MKKLATLLSLLTFLAFVNNVAPAEAGDGKPVKMGRETEIEETFIYVDTNSDKQDQKSEAEIKWETAHRYAHERSEER